MPSEQPPTRVEEAARALDKVIWLTDDVPHEVLVPARELHEALLNEPDKPALAQPQPREGSYNEQADRVFSEQPRGEGDDLAARTVQIIRNRAKIAREQGTTEAQIIRARALDEAANEFADILPALRASTHPARVEKLESRIYELIVERDSAVAALVAHQAYTFTCDNCGHSMHKRPISGPEATGSVAAPESGEGLRLTEDAGRGPDRPASPTEQGEDRTRVEWHDGIEHGDELALRQLAADIGCGIPYGCQPSVGKWYAAALDRVLDRLLPLDPAPEQGEARVEASENDDRKEVP